MIKLRNKITITKGASLLKELPEFLTKLKEQKILIYVPWGIIGEYMIKHAKDGVSRGRLIQTFRKLGFDLMRFSTNTERLPNARAIPVEEVSKGLREFVLPEGVRITISAYVDDPGRMFADILNDKRAPMGDFLMQLMRKKNIKPEGGSRGSLRKSNP